MRPLKVTFTRSSVRGTVLPRFGEYDFTPSMRGGGCGRDGEAGQGQDDGPCGDGHGPPRSGRDAGAACAGQGSERGREGECADHESGDAEGVAATVVGCGAAGGVGDGVASPAAPALHARHPTTPRRA